MESDKADEMFDRFEARLEELTGAVNRVAVQLERNRITWVEQEEKRGNLLWDIFVVEPRKK